MIGRLIIAIVSTILEEAAIAIIVLLGLPKLGIHMPLAGLIALMVAWGAYAIITYRMGSRALIKKPEAGLPHMVGSKGKVVSPLVPEGLVRIKGELWIAKSAERTIGTGEEVIVVGQNVKFDVEFLHGWAKREGYEFMGSYVDWRVIDTLVVARLQSALGNINPPDFKLATLCKEYGLPEPDHDAMDDIVATKKLLKEMLI